MELGKHLEKGIWGLADKFLPVLYGFGYIFLVIRVLPMEEFGNFVLLQEVFLIISGLAAAFALQPMLKYASEAEADVPGILGVAFWFNTAFVTFSASLVVVARIPMSDILNAHSFAPLVMYLPALLAASFIRNFTLVLLQTRFFIREVFWVDATHFLGAPLLIWIISRMHLFDTAVDLILVNIVSLSASSVVGFVLARPLFTIRIRPRRCDWARMWGYGSYSLGAIASYLTYTKADTFILSAFTGPVQVAVFNSAKVFTRVYEMVTQVVQMLVLPAVSRLSSRGERSRLVALVEKAILFLTILMLPVFLLFLLGPSLLVDLLYSGRYRDAIPILQVFAVLALVVPLLSVSSNTLLGLGHARLSFGLGLFMLVLSLIAYFTLIPWLGGIGAAIGITVASVFTAWITTARLQRELPFTVRSVLLKWNDIRMFVHNRFGV